MAMAHAVREVTGIDAQIKWPNDLVFSGKKLCGILLEISADLDRRMQNVRDVISKNVPKEEKIPFLGELI